MSETPNRLPDDQFTLKDVMASVITAKTVLVRNWKIVLLFSALGLGIGWALDYFMKKPPSYQAEVTFNLGSAGASGGGLPSGLGNLFGMGATADANIFTGENFFIWVKSGPVLERALMKEVNTGGRKVMLANFFIDSSGITEKRWEDLPHWQTFRFKRSDPDSFNLEERTILNDVITFASDITTIDEPNRKSSFMRLSVSTINENLSRAWASTLLETVDEFYAEIQTTKTRRTLKLLESRADSLYRILVGSESKLARESEYATIAVGPDVQTRIKQMTRNSEFIQQLYLEARAGVEQTRVSLVREAPLFTIIEPIKNPLDLSFDSGQKKKIGLLIGLMLSLIFIYIRSAYTAALEEKK